MYIHYHTAEFHNDMKILCMQSVAGINIVKTLKDPSMLYLDKFNEFI